MFQVSLNMFVVHALSSGLTQPTTAGMMRAVKVNAKKLALSTSLLSRHVHAIVFILTPANLSAKLFVSRLTNSLLQSLLANFPAQEATSMLVLRVNTQSLQQTTSLSSLSSFS